MQAIRYNLDLVVASQKIQHNASLFSGWMGSVSLEVEWFVMVSLVHRLQARVYMPASAIKRRNKPSCNSKFVLFVRYVVLSGQQVVALFVVSLFCFSSRTVDLVPGVS